MQNDPVVSKASELLRLGAMPSLDELRNGKVGCVAFSVSIIVIHKDMNQNILEIDISTVSSKLT